MALSRRVIETLIDLVENKLSCIEVHDREDSREVAWLERCGAELRGLIEPGARAPGSGPVAGLAKQDRARPPAAL